MDTDGVGSSQSHAAGETEDTMNVQRTLFAAAAAVCAIAAPAGAGNSASLQFSPIVVDRAGGSTSCSVDIVLGTCEELEVQPDGDDSCQVDVEVSVTSAPAGVRVCFLKGNDCMPVFTDSLTVRGRGTTGNPLAVIAADSTAALGAGAIRFAFAAAWRAGSRLR